MKWWWLIIFWLPLSVSAKGLDYQLQPRQIADGTYVLIGKTEDFSIRNGGNIINTGFIVTDEGVVVIDTGPSKIYGEQLREAIAAITKQPIVKVLHTNSHPDRFLGNQAFTDIPLVALEETRRVMQVEAEMLTDNMYRMVGKWMRGTEPVLPTASAELGRWQIGGHELELLAFEGHTDADLVILDHSTGVLFAGGLVFFERMPTTPHADLAQWREALLQLQKLPYQQLVPSHGEVTTGQEAIQQTLSYVDWLDQTLQQAAANGLSMAEVMQVQLPKEFADWGVGHLEFTRSVVHLYPALENAVLQPLEVESS